MRGKDVKNATITPNNTVDYAVSISLIATTINCYLTRMTKRMMHKCQNRRKAVSLKEPLPYFMVLSPELRKQAISVYHDHATISLAAFHR
jgi:hypothetical protein